MGVGRNESKGDEQGGADAAAYGCAGACPPHYTDCQGLCVDVTGDPDNCGACGNQCVSGICVKSVCAGNTAGSVVVSGNLPSADGRYSLYCAVIVKRVDAQTRAKTSINELLRS